MEKTVMADLEVGTCGRHDKVIGALKEGTGTMAVLKDGQERLEKKLDAMAEKQTTYMLQLDRMDRVLQNGLVDEVKKLSQKFDISTEYYERRLQKLEGFKWFMDFATGFRDKSFAYILYLAVAGGLVLTFMHFGSNIIKNIIK